MGGGAGNGRATSVPLQSWLKVKRFLALTDNQFKRSTAEFEQYIYVFELRWRAPDGFSGLDFGKARAVYLDQASTYGNYLVA